MLPLADFHVSCLQMAEMAFTSHICESPTDMILTGGLKVNEIYEKWRSEHDVRNQHKNQTTVHTGSVVTTRQYAHKKAFYQNNARNVDIGDHPRPLST